MTNSLFLKSHMKVIHRDAICFFSLFYGILVVRLNATASFAHGAHINLQNKNFSGFQQSSCALRRNQMWNYRRKTRQVTSWVNIGSHRHILAPWASLQVDFRRVLKLPSKKLIWSDLDNRLICLKSIFYKKILGKLVLTKICRILPYFFQLFDRAG